MTELASSSRPTILSLIDDAFASPKVSMEHKIAAINILRALDPAEVLNENRPFSPFRVDVSTGYSLFDDEGDEMESVAIRTPSKGTIAFVKKPLRSIENALATASPAKTDSPTDYYYRLSPMTEHHVENAVATPTATRHPSASRNGSKLSKEISPKKKKSPPRVQSAAFEMQEMGINHRTAVQGAQRKKKSPAKQQHEAQLPEIQEVEGASLRPSRPPSEVEIVHSIISSAAKQSCTGVNSPIRSKSIPNQRTTGGARPVRKSTGTATTTVAGRRRMFETIAEKRRASQPSSPHVTEEPQPSTEAVLPISNEVPSTKEATAPKPGPSRDSVLYEGLLALADTVSTLDTKVQAHVVTETASVARKISTPKLTAGTGPLPPLLRSATVSSVPVAINDDKPILMSAASAVRLQQLDNSHQTSRAISNDLLDRLRAARSGSCGNMSAATPGKHLRDHNSLLQQQLAELQARITHLEHKRDAAEASLHRKDEEKEALNTIINKLEDENDGMVSEIEQMETTLEALRTKVAQLQAEVARNTEALRTERMSVFKSTVSEIALQLDIDLSFHMPTIPEEEFECTIADLCRRVRNAYASTTSDAEGLAKTPVTAAPNATQFMPSPPGFDSTFLHLEVDEAEEEHQNTTQFASAEQVWESDIEAAEASEEDEDDFGDTQRAHFATSTPHRPLGAIKLSLSPQRSSQKKHKRSSALKRFRKYIRRLVRRVRGATDSPIKPVRFYASPRK